jgi:hypothetical protein
VGEATGEASEVALTAVDPLAAGVGIDGVSDGFA